MPVKHFFIAHKADKQIAKLPLSIQRKIEKAFDKIQTNPVSGIKLHGELQDYYKYRVGNYRIVYSSNTKESNVTVVKIEHRQGVYK